MVSRETGDDDEKSRGRAGKQRYDTRIVSVESGRLLSIPYSNEHDRGVHETCCQFGCVEGSCAGLSLECGGRLCCS